MLFEYKNGAFMKTVLLVAVARSVCKGEHFWSSRARNPLAASSTPYTAPTDFSSGPTWVWQNEFGEQTRHSPLIDEDKSIYITGARRIRKFTPDGSLAWLYTMEQGQKSSISPALYKGLLYLASFNQVDDAHKAVFLTTIDLKTGKKTWGTTIEKCYTNGDATSILVYNDTILIPTRGHLMSRPYPGGEDGNDQMTAVSVNGTILWKYTFDDIIWNFVPTTTGDGDILVGSQCGGVWRVNFDGKLIWRAGRRNPGHWCGCGGGVAGPNGIYYSEFNDHEHPNGRGVVQAIRISDGNLLWEKYFGRFEGWQYPAVGKVGPDGRLAVVAALGGITGHPRQPIPWMPNVLKPMTWDFYLKFSWFRWIIGVPSLPNAIVALDPLTGEELWRYVEEEWDHFAAKDDEESVGMRLQYHIDNEAICLPDPQGIPVIAGDGTVYGSSSHNGDLTAIKDSNNNGIIEPMEVSTFKTGKEFLNSPSLAPGMLVAAPCWGPVYVFKDKK